MENASAQALVLGIGNLLWADEGFGVRALEAFNDAYEVEEALLLDGGTQGLNLLEPVISHHHVLVFDAIDFGLAPGTLKVLRGRDVPAWTATRMSLHQSSFQELLAIAELQGRFPAQLTLIGVQPERLSDFGGSLSECVRARLPAAIGLAADELVAWGCAVRPRSVPAERLFDASLDIDAYEALRPSDEDACRVGDARFLAIRSAVEQREREAS